MTTPIPDSTVYVVLIVALLFVAIDGFRTIKAGHLHGSPVFIVFAIVLFCVAFIMTFCTAP